MISLARRIVLVAALCVLAFSSHAAPRAEHVFIISLDGGKPAAIEQSKMPALERLVAEGAHTWTATTIYPSITLPSHTSMLTGVGPEKHHILWNSWVPSRGLVTVPTVFSEAKRAGLTTAMFVGKEKFRHLVLTNSVDQFTYGRAAAVEVVKSEGGGAEEKHEGTVFAEKVAAQVATYIIAAQAQPVLHPFRRPGLCRPQVRLGFAATARSLRQDGCRTGRYREGNWPGGHREQDRGHCQRRPRGPRTDPRLEESRGHADTLDRLGQRREAGLYHHRAGEHL